MCNLAVRLGRIGMHKMGISDLRVSLCGMPRALTPCLTFVYPIDANAIRTERDLCLLQCYRIPINTTLENRPDQTELPTRLDSPRLSLTPRSYSETYTRLQASMHSLTHMQACTHTVDLIDLICQYISVPP